MLWPFAINGRLQCVRDRFRDNDRDQQTEDASSRPESAKDKRGKNDDDEERLPNVRIADRGHEQIQGRIRPSLVDKMKKLLIHLAGVKIGDSLRP